MYTRSEITFYSRIAKEKSRLENIKDPGVRRQEYCRLWKKWVKKHRPLLQLQFIENWINCKNLFPSDEDKAFFLEFAVTGRVLLTGIMKQLAKSKYPLHEAIVEDGKSALHYLVARYGSTESANFLEARYILRMNIDYFFKNCPRENYRDYRGFTYLHGACATGNQAALNALLSQPGVDVNLDSYECAPLHVAARYRWENAVRILLERGADPNQRDRDDGSRPLHALARPCLCDCVSNHKFCDERPACDKIVEMLIRNGANIEARNRHGDTPLQSAVMRLDTELVRTLLRHGASPAALNGDRMFGASFSTLELRCYAVTMDIVETMQLLQSAGYAMDFRTKLRMLKCWARVHERNDVAGYLVGDEIGNKFDRTDIFCQIVDQLYNRREFGFYMKQEVIDHLEQRGERLRSKIDKFMRDHDEPLYVYAWRDQIEKMKGIAMTEDVSLYRFCQMSPDEAHSLLKNAKNLRAPPMKHITCDYACMRIQARRRIANICMKQLVDFKMLAADLLATDYCGLNLPEHVCLKVAENMSDEDLLALFEKTNVDDVEQRCENDATRTRFVRLAS